MTEQQRIKFMEAWDYCDDNDKSDMFMYTYIADFAGLSIDEVQDYLFSEQSEVDRKVYFKKKYDN